MLKAFVGAGAYQGLRFLSWWSDEPDNCDCNRENKIALAANPWLYYAAVSGLGAGTAPAIKVGEYSVDSTFR
jgi:hypothetical protein